MNPEKTKEPEKVEENEKSMKFVVSPSTLKKLQAALAGKTGTMTPTMPAVPTMPMMPMMPMMMVIPVMTFFPMYPLQMYQTAPSPQELPDEIEIYCIDAEGKVVKVKMVKDSSITQK